MKTRLALLLLCVAALALSIGLYKTQVAPAGPVPADSPASFAPAAAEPAPSAASEASLTATPQPIATRALQNPVARPEPEQPSTTTNRIERLNQLREQFRSLAAGDQRTAMAAAKQLTNEVERETALLALVTQWTHGELGPPRQRAQAIALYGLEAGLGMELSKDPALAVLWANELTQDYGRNALLGQSLNPLLNSDPAAAFALAGQLPPGEQREFFDTVFATWAGKDTEAALQWAQQLPDPAQQDAALQAIRSVAPVGIGAALSVQDGYPVINDLLPGTPAQLSGQFHKGDRILGLAQGDNAFVDTHSLALSDVVQMIRGAPGTVLQLQVLPAGASPGSLPQTISILRDQLKFKQ